MDRRSFIEQMALGSGVFASASFFNFPKTAHPKKKTVTYQPEENRLSADLVIIGGGMGGCAAALAALRNNLTVVLAEETDWLGGQLTSQGVPPDEHYWIETHGATQLYRDFRTAVREYYKRNYPMTEQPTRRFHFSLVL